jgi:UDPglucose 6-dehydrogenase
MAYSAYDPAVMERAKGTLGDTISYAQDAYEAMKGADAVLILTEWTEFGTLDLARVKELLNYPIVLDARNLYTPRDMFQAALNYYSIGRVPLEISHPVPGYAKIGKIGSSAEK